MIALKQGALGFCGCVLLVAGPVFAGEGANAPNPLENGTPVGSESDSTDPLNSTQQVEVRVRVTWVSGSLVRVDLGAESGLLVGDRIRFEPLGLANVEGVVQSVGNRQAEVLLPAGDYGMQPGVRGWAKVSPVERTAFEGTDLADQGNEENDWKEGMPLLAGTKTVKPEKRPTVWSGNVTLMGSMSEDSTGSRRKDYYSQLGFSLRGNNPWGRGGRVNLDMEVQRSSLEFDSGVAGTSGESDLYLRVRRASYAFGGDRDRARRYQFGRFYSTIMPELGLLDGVEVSQRREDGLLFGTSFGWQPSYGPEIQFEDAMALSGWVQKPLGPELRSSIAAAMQKTWFHGKPDRDWLLFKGHYANEGPWSANGSVSFDVYGSEDIAKASGLETTEYRGRIKRKFGPDAGLALYHSMVRFPEVRRDLPVDYAVGQVSNARTLRTGLNGWIPISDRSDLSARHEVWSDENADGGYTEVSVDSELDHAFASRWYISGFVSNTEVADITALRLGLRGLAHGGSWSAGLDLGHYDRFQADGTSQTDFEGSLRGGWTGSIGNRWFLGLDAALHFGDDRDANSLGFLLQRSF